MISIDSIATHRGYRLPVVRELTRSDAAPDVPPDRPSTALTQPELVRASLLAAPARGR
jgi:hypothetical protein